MALSTLLRSPACTSRLISQHIRLIAKQPLVAQRAIASTVQASFNFPDLKTNNTPIFNAVRQFKTTPVCLSDEVPHDHAKLWVVEKMTAGMMLFFIPVAVIMPCKPLDIIVATLITAHSFWGLEAIAVDYVRESLFGKVIPKIAIGLVYLLHIVTFGGLMYIITHDVGLANLIRQFWSIKRTENA